MRHRFVAVAIVLMVAFGTTSCGGAPQLPVDQAQAYAEISHPGGEDFLLRLSSFDWDDGGKAAGESFRWISADARSPQAKQAEHAGQAAYVIAEFLASRHDELSHLSAGWFGLQNKPLGELNPDLLQGFSSALTPYQGAFIGDSRGVSGFPKIAGPDDADLSQLKAIFSVIDGETQIGNQFARAADERVRTYLKEYARQRSTGQPSARDALANAGSLAGVVAGGARQSGNKSIKVHTARYWANWANYEMASALGVRPAEGSIGNEFFTAEGALKSPDNVSSEELVLLSNALQNLVFRAGITDIDAELRHFYDAAVAA